MNDHSQNDTQHQVVALKYRPQSFENLVGQDHIATALGNAIRQNRVGHAYLFTGARGVGKTSSARIFAKCLNCEQGPTPTPCETCEPCMAISVGEDVDVLEIDGASNRGIDEIRQLRANASIRPGRSKFKIYIIDEVHMLTKEAFNALLKTLEEPPSHVKFIFCTTDPEKIPITVLSRCQRFDFSPVQTDEIAGRLRMIASNEGVEIDDPAILLLARRANGSMRDSQSLLEQMLSFSDKKISIDDVHQLLGTADISRIAELATAMAEKDSANALNLVHAGISQGVDAGQLMGQLLGYYRDMMAVRVESNEEVLLSCSGDDLPALKKLAEQYGLETILSIVQILDATLVRMQSSLHGRTLLEVAIVRICNLEHLDSISELISTLSSSGSTQVAKKATPAPSGRPRVQMQRVEVSAKDEKKKAVVEPESINQTVDREKTNDSTRVGRSPNSPTNNSTTPERGSSDVASPFATSNVEAIWEQVLTELGDMTADMASDYEAIKVPAEDRIVVTLVDKVNKDFCSKPDRKQKFEEKLLAITGKKIRIDFLASEKQKSERAPEPKMSRNQQIRQLQENDFVANAMKMFDADVVGFQERPPRRSG